MPTILREGGYQFVIYYNDHQPPHVHVKKAEHDARIRIDILELMSNEGFNTRQIKRILAIAEANQSLLMTAWNSIHTEDED